MAGDGGVPASPATSSWHSPHRLPADATFASQPLWASIGYTLRALLGACTAQPDLRGLLLISDGAARLDPEEVPDKACRRHRRSRS